MMDDTELPEEDIFMPLDSEDEVVDPDEDNPESHGFSITSDDAEPEPDY